jgi:hypothetical protein
MTVWSGSLPLPIGEAASPSGWDVDHASPAYPWTLKLSDREAQSPKRMESWTGASSLSLQRLTAASGFKFPLSTPTSPTSPTPQSPPTQGEVSPTHPASSEPTTLPAVPVVPPTIITSDLTDEPGADLDEPATEPPIDLPSHPDVPQASTIDEAISNFHDAVKTPAEETEEASATTDTAVREPIAPETHLPVNEERADEQMEIGREPTFRTVRTQDRPQTDESGAEHGQDTEVGMDEVDLS